MASPFQQQVRNRKVLYIAIILVLFTGAWGWRKMVINPEAEALALREESRGDVELLGSVVRLSLTGSRGLVTCMLWSTAFEQQKKNQWNALEVSVRALTRLQPHFITPWLFQSWNLAYNVSVEADRPRDKFFYITRGIELLGRGERQNRHHPDLRWSIGFYTMNKLGRSDETNYQRSLLQLTMIPPNERDPARFWMPSDEGPQLNMEEFEKFCQDHPQLVRRLREGMHKDSVRAQKQLFTCDTPEDVVRFLEDNYQVPGVYPVETPTAPAQARAGAWVRAAAPPPPLPELERFPVLPPPLGDPARGGKTPFDSNALTSASTLGDADDPYTVAHAWFAYAQEPIPDPSALPGIPKPITDRTTQRRPRHMTTLIFRNYPAQGRRYHAERLQEEGWHDEEKWDASEWFSRGRTVRVGGGANWSQVAWERAFLAWESHGKDNHILFDDAAAEENMKKAAEAFARRHNMMLYGNPPALDEGKLDAEHLRQYKAAQFMFEYDFYRRVSNFPHHYNRCLVERKPETVAARKMFYKAERRNMAGEPQKALAIYTTPITAAAAREDETLKPLEGHTPLTAWRDLVLRKNKEYRRDSFIQEQTAEYQTHFLLLENRFRGRDLKEKLVKVAALLPLVPKMDPEVARPPIVDGPFDGVADEEGVLFLPDHAVESIMDRLGLPARRRRGPAPGETPKGPPVRKEIDPKSKG